MELSEKALEAKKAYAKKYRETHKEELKEYHKKWKSNNKDKVEASYIRYWEKKGLEM